MIYFLSAYQWRDGTEDTNRFLLDGFPRSVEQAQCFERDIAEVSFLLYLEASHATWYRKCGHPGWCLEESPYKRSLAPQSKAPGATLLVFFFGNSI